MSDSPGNPPQPDPPAFDPVPVRARRDGWTPERQRAFIAHLHRRRCVDAAARSVGMSRESAYRLRRRTGAASFVSVWDAIIASRPRGRTHIHLLWHRAIYGTTRRIHRDGIVIDHVKPDNAAAMKLLRRVDRLKRSAARRERSR